MAQRTSKTLVKTPKGIIVRCVHDEIVPVEDLKPNPNNPNKHPKAQLALLAKLLKKQGWRYCIVVSNQSGLIVTGHGRLDAAISYGETAVPVDYQDFDSPEDERAHMLADNRIAELAEMDVKALERELKALEASGYDLELAGFAKEALASMSGWTEPESLNKGSVLKLIDVTIAEPKTKVIEGQIWMAGQHFVACMDVFSDWQKWQKLLVPDSIFLPFAGPLVLITEKAKTHVLIVVNPDPYLCGHILDRWRDVTGKEPSNDD